MRVTGLNEQLSATSSVQSPCSPMAFVIGIVLFSSTSFAALILAHSNERNREGDRIEYAKVDKKSSSVSGK